ncbi:hypothetical protein AB0P21_02210 [Kribbella sp. NPDC056861]|uniref:hypothetical protein n=1 Tax=Kribbella sp. NPDC056861 TaxID=3154857 RepID=UPI00342E5ED5
MDGKSGGERLPPGAGELGEQQAVGAVAVSAMTIVQVVVAAFAMLLAGCYSGIGRWTVKVAASG